MEKDKRLYIVLMILVVLIVSIFSFSYAFFMNKKEEHGKLNIVAGTLDYKIVGEEIEDNQIIVEKNTTKEIKLVITSLNSIDSKYELYYIGNEQVEVGYVEPEVNTKGEIKSLKSKEVTIYIRNNTTTSQMVTLGVEGGLWNNDLVLVKGKSIPKIKIEIYKEPILNGTDPVLSDNLVPVIIDDSGKVRKADIYNKWYRYEEKKWANAVVLKDDTISYENNSIIPEENIESYFVWIPRYKYKLFDTTGPQVIDIIFEDKNTTVSKGSNTGEYLTHPAFTVFDSNGLWVGKFETGYEGAESTTAAEVNSSDSSKIVIKPNVYSWRNITVGNAFEASYNYLRGNESHMMKNTEWGAVAYLTSSNYGRCENGSCSEVRINNNSNLITGYASVKGTEESGYTTEGTSPKVDGNNTINYLNSNSVVASTTGNYSGIYDMSGGAFEYVTGYTTGSSIGVGGKSEITTFHADFFTNPNWNKYYDKYTSIADTDYNNRILGDATGELGPSSQRRSWYSDFACFARSLDPWFVRGGHYLNNTASGTFAFDCANGGTHDSNFFSFRVVFAF